MRRKPKKTRQFKRKANFSVYIVECADGTYYTGYTNDLKRRLALHNSGKGAKYVARKLPVRLVYAKPYKYYKLAIKAEKAIKSLSRQRKENLVQEHARSRNSRKKHQPVNSRRKHGHSRFNGTSVFFRAKT